MTDPIQSATIAMEPEQTKETSTTATRSWTEVESAIWERRKLAPKYPKNLTVYEILHQATKAFEDDTPEVVVGVGGWVVPTDVSASSVPGVKETRHVPRGIGLMMRIMQLDSDKTLPVRHRFEEFVECVASTFGNTPWPSWKHAWRDYADYAGLTTTAHKTAMLKEGFPA